MLSIMKLSDMSWFSKFVVIIMAVVIGAVPCFGSVNCHPSGSSSGCCRPHCPMMATIQVKATTQSAAESGTEMRPSCERSAHSSSLAAIMLKTALCSLIC